MKFLAALMGTCLALALSTHAAWGQPAGNPQIDPPKTRKILAGGQAARRLAPVQPDRLIDARDQYALENGQQVGLLRSADEVAVRFGANITAERGMGSLRAIKGFERLESVAKTTMGRPSETQILRNVGGVNVTTVAGLPEVQFAYPVFVDPDSNKRMIPTDEVLVRLANGAQLADIAPAIAAAGLQVVERTGSQRMQVYLLRLVAPKTGDALTASVALAANAKVAWAEPNFIRELELNLTPNDSLFNQLQNMHNTGQNGGVSDADIDAPEAWNSSTGSASVTIAIIDDGVDTGHTDLNIFHNPGESGGGKETNGIDDDGNGKIDDYRGWDFANSDNNPTPVGANGHGTGTAGVAAAIGNNGYRVAGVAFGSKVLPVKIAGDNGVFTTSSIIGNAISYAADYADVLSNSWGGGSISSFINNAIDDAVTNGRAGKGSPVFFATGNAASTWYQGGSRIRLSTTGLSGNYYIGFFFEKGGSPGGENAARVDNVCLIDSDGYTHKIGVLPRQDFEGVFPPSGWWLANSGGAATNWSASSTNAYTGCGGTLSARSPSLSNGQYAWLFTPLVSINGTETLAFAGSVSMGNTSAFYVDIYDSTQTYVGSWGPWNGVPGVLTSVGYPASYANSIAVGGSTDCDRRPNYSQYGTGVDCVAPTNGGWNDIVTLDPLGSVGWTSTDYKTNFGGTSTACPMAAGVAALMISKSPTVTASQIRTLMRSTCDKIGGVTYDGSGFNSFYGYGRVNANAALAALCSPPANPGSITAVNTVCPNSSGNSASVPAQSGITHVWSISNGSLSSTTGDSITFSVAAASPAVLTVQSRDNVTLCLSTGTSTKNVTVGDAVVPNISSCGSDQNTSANASCQAAVPDFTANVTATDNCTSSGQLIKTQSPTVGTFVGVGPNTVTMTVKDLANNQATCTRTFTVTDGTIPTIISCGANASAPANANCQAAVPNMTGDVSANDNCTASGSLTKTQNPTAGTLLGLGPHTVTITVKDQANNSATCTKTFTVIGTDADGDGTPDCQDGCPNDPNKIAPGVCGCGVAETDSDSDGVPNCHDICPNTVVGAIVDGNGCPPVIPGDMNRDGDVDDSDVNAFIACMTGPDLGPVAVGCENAELDGDGDADQSDFSKVQRCLSGTNVPADPNCAN